MAIERKIIIESATEMKVAPLTSWALPTDRQKRTDMVFEVSPVYAVDAGQYNSATILEEDNVPMTVIVKLEMADMLAHVKELAKPELIKPFVTNAIENYAVDMGVIDKEGTIFFMKEYGFTITEEKASDIVADLVENHTPESLASALKKGMDASDMERLIEALKSTPW